jgi:hypothetical protein
VFESRQGLGIFLFTTAASTPALGPTHPPIQWVPVTLSREVKWPGRETDRSRPSSAEFKNAWSYTSTPPNTPSWRGAQLKHRDSFTFNLLIFVFLLGLLVVTSLLRIRSARSGCPEVSCGFPLVFVCASLIGPTLKRSQPVDAAYPMQLGGIVKYPQ